MPKAAEKLSIGPRFVVMIAGRSPPVPKQSRSSTWYIDPGNISNTHKKIRSCVLSKKKNSEQFSFLRPDVSNVYLDPFFFLSLSRLSISHKQNGGYTELLETKLTVLVCQT